MVSINLKDELCILTLFCKRYYHSIGSLAVFESLQSQNINFLLFVRLLALNLKAKLRWFYLLIKIHINTPHYKSGKALYSLKQEHKSRRGVKLVWMVADALQNILYCDKILLLPSASYSTPSQYFPLHWTGAARVERA